MLPPRRLRCLLKQAVEHQAERCSCHDVAWRTDLDNVSLLTDHDCGSDNVCISKIMHQTHWILEQYFAFWFQCAVPCANSPGVKWSLWRSLACQIFARWLEIGIRLKRHDSHHMGRWSTKESGQNASNARRPYIRNIVFAMESRFEASVGRRTRRLSKRLDLERWRRESSYYNVAFKWR